MPGSSRRSSARIVLSFSLAVLAVTAAALATGCLDDRDLVAPTVDEDPTLPHLDVNGTRLHVTEMGTPGDPLIVFIHGGPGGDHRSYLEWSALADHYHLVMYDQRGAGLSRRENKDTLRVEYSLGDLEALIQATRQGSEPVVLFTHSWGGSLATAYINEDPSRVQGLVLVEPPGFTRTELEDFYKHSFDAVTLSEGVDDILWSAPFLSPEQHARWDYLAFAQNSGEGAIGGLDPVHREPGWRWGAALTYWLPQQIGQFDWTTRLSEVTFPVLWFRSDRNRTISAAQQEALAKHYPQVEMHLVEGVGHDLLYQRRVELMPTVEEYLARVTKTVQKVET
jgi:proline iminopeptidase